MAVLAKKLNIQKTGASTVACDIYSTTAEAGSNYFPVTVNGVSGTHYVALGSTTDSNATVGRAQKSGTTYAIKSKAKLPYAETSYTSVGTHTFTVPTGITRIRVAVCGGGGGSITGANLTSNMSRNGGASSFGSLITATGGSCGFTVTSETVSGGKWGSSTVYHYTGIIAGGTPNGNSGYMHLDDGTAHPGGSGFALSFTKSAGSYGQGGGFTKVGWANQANGYTGSGGSGGYNTGYYNVTPGTNYTVTVGAGGERWYNGNYGGYNPGYGGTSGFVLVAYGGDI